MKNNDLTVNDILEALAIRTNDVLRPDKKSKNKKNNAYFWAFKLLYLIIFIMIIKSVFNCFDKVGVSFIYVVGKSLRGILSTVWSVSLSFFKNLIILYLIYDNYKVLVNSEYYSNLYAKNKKLCNRKENIFYVIELVLKVCSVFFMIAIALLGLASLYVFVIVLIMLFKNIYIISPFIITGALFLLSLLIFLHIKNNFFEKKQTIVRNHFIFAISILVIGCLAFGYEISSYEVVNNLPSEMELIVKETTFDINDGKKINIINSSKLNNIEIIYDEKLDDKLYISFEYFKTANVKYTYTFNENDDLNLAFSSKLDFHPRNVNDVLELIHSTFNRKTIYNYNLFKYPNIVMRVNPKYENLISIKKNEN